MSDRNVFLTVLEATDPGLDSLCPSPLSSSKGYITTLGHSQTDLLTISQFNFLSYTSLFFNNSIFKSVPCTSILLSRLFLRGLEGSAFIIHTFYLPENARTQWNSAKNGTAPQQGWSFPCCPNLFLIYFSIYYDGLNHLHFYQYATPTRCSLVARSFLHYFLLSFSFWQSHADKGEFRLSECALYSSSRLYSLLITNPLSHIEPLQQHLHILVPAVNLISSFGLSFINELVYKRQDLFLTVLEVGKSRHSLTGYILNTHFLIHMRHLLATLLHS